MADDERAMELLVELHDGLARLGPGDGRSTRKALSLCEGLVAEPQILDVGCGTGAQTLELLNHSDGVVTAVDLFPGFLEVLEQRCAARGLEGRVRARAADMGDLPFGDASFDLIWSEGAVYLMGFDNALRSWRGLLRPGGYLVVSEMSWFRPSRPEEIASFWAANYPSMRSVEENLTAARGLGWRIVGHFPLPVSAWSDEFYGPLRERIPVFRDAHPGDPEAQILADETEREMSLMERFSDWCGYEFFVLQTTG